MRARLIKGRAPSLTAIPVFDAVLSAGGRRQLRSLATDVKAGRDEVVAVQGEVSRDLLVLGEGFVKLSKGLPDGRQLIVAFRAAGDLVSLHRCDAPWPATAQAISDCRLFRIQWDELQNLADRYPALDRTLFDLASDEAANLQDQLLTLGRKTTEERLASFLLDFSLPLAAPSNLSREILLPMRRPEIADYLGMTTESVSREFSRFKHRRIIAMPRPSCVVLLNKPALEALALGRWSLETRSTAIRRSDRAPEQLRTAASGS